jgi:putative ABC transport system substrate-binding protein
MNYRRKLVVALGWSVLAVPLQSVAQQRGSPKRIGVLLTLLSPESKEAQAFQRGLKDAGYTEGRDVVIEWRSVGADFARLPELAADLVRRKVDAIVVDTTPATQAAMRATAAIPIVMTINADPVGTNLVASLARPGGNVTGLSIMLAELSDKRLQLLRDAIPHVVRIVVLYNSPIPYHAKAIERLKAAAPMLTLELSFVDVLTPEQFESAFSVVKRVRAEALYVLDCPLFYNHRTTIVALASKARIPVISGEGPFADAGGLMTYGANYEDQMRRAAGYVDKIFKGASPGNLPIEQPTRFDLVINAKTAKALGINLSSMIHVQATRVIQ